MYRYIRGLGKWKTSLLNMILDNIETIRDFAKKHPAALTIMEGGEHWFHTEEQMRFLDDWIMKENHQ